MWDSSRGFEDILQYSKLRKELDSTTPFIFKLFRFSDPQLLAFNISYVKNVQLIGITVEMCFEYQPWPQEFPLAKHVGGRDYSLASRKLLS